MRNRIVERNSSRVTRYALSSDGFTFLELLIVLILVTLMLGLSAVLFGNTLSSSRLDAAARDISATIRHAKSLAQMNGEKQTVLISIDSRHYGREGGGTKALPKGVQIMAIDPFSGEVRQGEYRITFQPYAGVEGGTVVVWNSKRSVSIQLDPVVGTVMIK